MNNKTNNTAKITFLALCGIVATAPWLSGCGNDRPAQANNETLQPTSVATSSNTAPGSAVESQSGAMSGHGHIAPHGGAMQVLGRNTNHVEAIREPSGTIRVFILGAKESEMYPITFSEIEAEVRAGTEEAQTISLKAKPQTGETEGSSRFVGTLPAALKKKPVSLTLTLPLADNIHVVRFSAEELAPKTETASAAHPEMPTPLATSGDITPEEKALFLTPGGRYTAADIGANGNMVPRQKFQGEMAKHDRNPKKGDRICPITDTLANPKFAWIIGGKTYLFCCPPCVEEFLKTAKEKPETVQEPTAYVQK